MKTIWKFELETINEQKITIPTGAELLSVQTQYGAPCLWALVDTESINESRYFEILGTGHMMDNIKYNRKYIGTYQLHQGSFVGHLFEIIKK